MTCGKNREDCNLLCATLKEEGIFYYCFSSSVFYVLYMSIIVYSFDKLVSFRQRGVGLFLSLLRFFQKSLITKQQLGSVLGSLQTSLCHFRGRFGK